MRNKLYLLALLLVLMHLPILAQIGGGYDPSNPGDPGTPVLKYTLTLKAIPTDGGSFSVTSTKVYVGENYNIRAYPNTDFVFVAWICDGDTISKSASYNITMPDHDVEIIGVFEYNPSNPADPYEQALKYQLSLRAEPMNSGSFNINNERFAVGSVNTLRAYTNTDFVFKHWRIGDSILSTNQNMDFTMPAHNVEIIGQFEYSPANPANPNANYWNPITGEVIVDDFSSGYLSNAVSTLLNNHGANWSDVQMITVAGRMNNNDFGIANNCSNCTLLDLSRVAGITEVPSYAFDYTNLESVYLPATIEKIGDYAFSQCTKLSSLIIYAMTPPSLGWGVFNGVPEGLVVYVPAAAIAQYQDDPNWNKYIILPIQEDIRTLTVNLPASANPVNYTNMWLELTNTKSGQRMHYVMDNRTSYKFNNIIRNTTWDVVLRNPSGDIFGRIDNVEVGDEDVTVTFASLSKPYNVTLSILTPSGQDVTSQAEITWTDADGKYITQEPSIAGLPLGYQLIYSVKLPQELAMAYIGPSNTQYTVKNGNNSIVCHLSAISNVTVSGKVKDGSTGLPLKGANITASQTFGGKYDKTISTTTDNSGEFTFEIARVPTVFGASATDYINKSLAFDVMAATGNIVLPDLSLDPITGATISIGFTYTPCHASDEEAEPQNWYSDFNNVDYSIYNKTKNHTLDQFSAQFPQIVLLEDVNDGDVLELTAISRKDAFKPVMATVTIAEQKANATFNIIELGKIAASFKNNSNPTVVGTLYDDSGKLVGTYNYSNAALEIDNLSDGNYTLITMGSSQFFNTIYDLTSLPQTGLISGVDYVRTAVQVQSGIISKVEINNVPLLDESKFYYTGENTSFTVNKPSIVIGNYLTLTGHLDFKPVYAGQVSNVSLIVDLPESCSFVDNSVMVGNSTSSYTINGNQITIPMTRYTDRVRFCVIPTVGGNFAPSAFAQFDINGKTIKQPIGSANYTAQELSINVPTTVAKTSIPITGTAIGICDIEIYDNDILIGQTTSLANGTWSTTCELYNPYNMSLHDICAIITTKQGLSLPSEKTLCLYDMDAIQVSMVKMYHYNPERGTYEIEYDFQNPTTKRQNWTVYYPKKMFTFTINFTNNSPDNLSNVILFVHTADGCCLPFYPTYDYEQDLWIVNCDLGNKADSKYPINVSIDYEANTNLDSTSIVSLFDGCTNATPINEIDCNYVNEQNGSTNAEYLFNDSRIDITSNYSSVSSVPTGIEFEKDTLFDQIVYTNCNFDDNTLTVLYPRGFIDMLSLLTNDESKGFYNWANSVCTSNYLQIKIQIDEDSLNNSYHAKRAPSVGSIVGHSFFAGRTGWRFYSMNRQAQDHFNQLDDLANRLNAVTCMPDEYKDEIRKRIDELFDRYFNIRATSSFMESSRMAMTSPLYAITYAGGWLHFSSEVGFSIRRRQISNFIAGYEANCPPPRNGPGHHRPNRPDDDVSIDPSGFVYECVPSNRLEGVTATCFYKETVEDMYGDLHDEVVLWDAAQYGQENPLFTDENGFYRWDVPVGLWQVKYEKAGYETAYSDWLPVPPPQLDINVAMTQMRQPEVVKARAYTKSVEFEFDKYMKTETLTTDNISVIANGIPVNGTIQLLNEEQAYEGEETFASRVRFNSASPFNADEVTLHVCHRVESYAGLRMSDDYEQTLSVEYEMEKIDVDTTINVLYGDSRQLTVTVLPVNASKGKTLTVSNSSPMILSVDAESYSLGSNGKAVITVHGDLPGTGSLLFGIDGYDLSAATRINVLMENQMNVATPTASVASGSEVPKGTAVYLSCATEGSTIYYTLDGSCPCDDTPSRKVYDGSPIIINGSMTIKAMATAPDLYDSDVATFVYRVSSEINGDVNRDGEVNIADINVVIDVILSSNVSPEVLAHADVNGDSEVNIADINVIIDIILNAKGLMAYVVNCDDKIHLDNVTIKPGEVRTMQVTMDNASHYSAMQCDIVLPAGLTLIGTNATGSNVSKMGSIDERSSRALSYSPTKVPFASNGLGILTLTVRADEALEAESEIVLTNVVLADAENKAWHLADCKAQVNNTSGVNDLTSVADKVWVEGHTLFIEAHHDGTAQLATINGIVCDIPVKAGVNQHRLDQGIYIVVINGVSHKIAIK